MAERYLYEVRPVKPIIIGNTSIRRPCSIQLTKEEVKEYMHSASIYRKFTDVNIEPIKVTGENLDSLHRKSFKSEAKVFSVPKVELPKEEKVEIPEEEKKEEVIEDDAKKLKEEESSVTLSDDTEETIEVETEVSNSSYEEVKEEDETVENDSKVEIDSSSESIEKENVDVEVSENSEETTEVETEEVKTNTQPTINLKNNHQNKKYNGKNKNNYKK